MQIFWTLRTFGRSVKPFVQNAIRYHGFISTIDHLEN